MKSYNHLMEQFLSPDNYRLAVRNATKHKSFTKRKYRKAKYYADHAEEIMPGMLEYAANFRNFNHIPKTIYDGVQRKKREIIVPSMPEQIVHHMVINVLKPIFMRPMYEHSYGSIPGRGGHRGKKTIEKWIRNDPKGVKYCLKLDIQKYFNSIDHSVLKQKLRKLIHDEKFLKILYEIIDVTPNGIPLGFYTSQWFANWFLTDLDHYIKEKLCVKYYIRYMDDMVVFGSNKRELHRVFEEIQKELGKLGLSVKGNWQVFKFDYLNRKGKRIGRDLDFMGFRFFRDKTILRKSIMLKACRKAKRMCKKYRKSVHDSRQMMSYLGWIDCTDSYQMYEKWIKPYVSFRNLRKKISAIDRRNALCGK